MKKILIAICLLSVVGCKALIVDTSIPAAEAGDLTLIGACDAMPGQGGDMCRFKDGSPITAVWRLILPAKGRVTGGQVVVTYGGVKKEYAVTSNILEIPFREVVGAETWDKDDHSLTTAMARASIQYQGNTTPEQVQVRGIALIVVTDAAYDPLPIDSGLQAFKTTCKVQYSTAGRSALSCQ